MKDLPPNWKHVHGNFYVVRTQAGFAQAIKHYWGEDDKPEVHGYPRSYPSLVCFSNGYNGSIFVQASCVHVTQMREALKDQ
ncbi:hypothetical protein [Burkholderia phage BCSR5]|nr:hypothetical protein [Burkholderia phage BCSR5]